MIFEQNKTFEKVGEKTGYLFAYFLFTTILYFIFSFLNKLPYNWPYFHVMGATFIIVIIGLIVKRLLK